MIKKIYFLQPISLPNVRIAQLGNSPAYQFKVSEDFKSVTFWHVATGQRYTTTVPFVAEHVPDKDALATYIANVTEANESLANGILEAKGLIPSPVPTPAESPKAKGKGKK